MVRLIVALMVPLAAFAHNLMPAPAKMQRGQGRLAIDGNFRIDLTGYSESRLDAAADRLVDAIVRLTSIPMRHSRAGPATLLVHCEHAGEPVQRMGEDESYRLTVTSQQARLEAAEPLGILRGMQTFLQLVELDGTGFGAAAVRIDDQPRFPWRGLTLDVGRHFMPIEDVKRTLDGMAAVKLNVFHWHLSENQGFRIESKRFPKFQELSSDSQYYTQEQARDIIAYARDRGIRVIPEFDMPGHSTSWFVAYPELASAPGPFKNERNWGVFDAAMDPTREETYQFLDTFIGEMAALFPDEYFHIGGDEVNGRQWNANPHIQEFKRAHGMTKNEQLQAYFTRRVQGLVTKHGKKMIGWDEILTADMPHDIVVQSWRGQKSLAAAARLGVNGILSSGYYLDLEHSPAYHYAVDPLGNGAASLSDTEKARILGGEACMWSEFVTPEVLDGRVWPRTAVIAERLWSPASVTDVGDMQRRMEIVSRELQALGMRHISSYEKMLARLAGTGAIEPVRTLAEVVEPVKDYGREAAHKYDAFTPLDRLVDTVQASSEVARQFALLVDARNIPAMREWLVRWRDNDARLAPVMANSALLQEAAGISKNLSALAAAGLQALDDLKAGRHAPADWVAQQTALLDHAKHPQAELLLSVEPPIRKLIEAVQ